ncbi:MAG: hypothetical protein ACK6D7_22200, partial [Acidobacteriota bacterium]
MRRGVWLWLAGGLVAAVGLGEGVRRFGFTPEQKAFYANERTLNFVRPGLELRVLGAEIGADGTMVATVRITDPLGVPLDREGRLTPGAVGLSFVAATIPADNKHYTAYTTRVQRSPLTGVSATQA